jgi:uncharacterized LabA/DUF88 family protein
VTDTQDRRLAVLIDADNTSPKLIREMLEELAGEGTLTVKRAYGDWTTPQLGGWKDHLLAHAISPIQQFAYTTGKNSTDSALIIDAMDLLYSGNVEGFVIVSSDSDFTRLATRLKESGMRVFGVGQRKTPKPFVEACEKFIFLEVLSQDTREQAPARADEGALQSLITKVLARTAQDDDWSALGSVGSQLLRTDPSFDPRAYGFAKLSDLVGSLPYVEVKELEDTPGRGQLWVRPKRRRPEAKKAAAKRTAAKKTAKASAKAQTPTAS